MIDIEKAKKSFKDYLQSFDINNGRISAKIIHTYSVVDSANYITNDLNLSDDDKKLAELIALLHDIGRFEQLKIYDTYSDSESIDHADFGIKLLFEDNLIKEFIDTDEYDNVIYKAIKYHNKYKIPDGLNEKELLHAKIIRDADKTDNFINFAYRENLEVMYKNSLDAIGKEDITNKVYQNFLDGKLIVNDDRKTSMDSWVSFFAFVFDYNFPSGLKFIKENGYIDMMYNRIKYTNPITAERMINVRNIANKYIYKMLK